MNVPGKPAEYLKAAREIEAAQDARSTPVPKLAVLASFTADFLRPYLIVESEALGAPLRPWFAPFNTFEQLLLDPSSELAALAPDVTWISIRIEDADPSLFEDAAELGPAGVAQRLGALVGRLVNLAEAARARGKGSILVSNLSASSPRIDALFDASDPDGFVHLVADANRQLARALRKISDAHVFDWVGLVAEVGRDAWRDDRLWYMARAPVAGPVQARLARRLARAARALLQPPSKVLVLDLDNTLWGGVLGDDGQEGLKLGDEYPGSVFKDVQRALLGLRKRGFLLAIASKNDPEPVLAALDSHPEMVLRREHFAAVEAGWHPKPESLQRIAEKINVGLDSLVFVDDNPVERAQVRATLPMVHVVELPPNPIGYLGALRELHLIDQPRVLEEDRARANMIVQDEARRVLESRVTDVAEYLRQLEMVAEVGQASAVNEDRIHQLIHKTNQFNLTTRRHKQDELKRMMGSPEARVAWLRLRDRFGDLGLVAVGIVRRLQAEQWEIDTYLMSCRVMGRGVEQAFLHYLAELARQGGASRLRGLYIPTAKNHMVKDFFPSQGFSELPPIESGRQFELDLLNNPPPWPPAITRRDALSEAIAPAGGFTPPITGPDATEKSK